MEVAMERISTLDRRSFPIVAATIVLGLLLFCADSTYSQIRIMPLGDSITKGVTGSSDSTGYRRALYLSLTGAGYSVNFVGSQANGHPTDFDRAHEGHGGWRADQIRDSISGWLTKNPADIILLHIGTNDISQGQTVGSTVHEVKQILDRIDAKSTATVVFLARIINRSDGYSARTTTYNRQLKDSADRWIMNGDRIIVVDQETALSYPADLADAVHPNDTGYGKMAQCWFTALSSYLAAGVASAATSTITAAPTSIIADGTSASTITIQLKDANGNNLTKGGDAVTLATTAGTLTAVTDHSNGTYTATLTSSTTLETATITGTVNAVAIVDDATVTFIVGTPPAAPVLATPANGATGIATNPTLTWNASSGATSYRLQVSTDAGFATTVVDQSNITTTSYAVSNLATNTTYYWHVNATNSGGTSAYSTAWSFTTVQPAPGAPVLATPANGATGIATNPTLTWNASSGATSYRVQVSTSSAFTTTVVDQSNITTTSYAVSSLSTNTIYYWHVNATNSGGTSAYSTAWSFTTVPPQPPVAPVLATPANGATGIATNPTLTWNASTGATSYRVQVSTSSAFTTTVVDQSNITTTTYAVSSLATNTTYYWHVNATNSGGTSAYSTAWSFTTVAPPPPPAVPVLATPSDGATGIATNPTLTWNASTGATSYRVQVSTSSAFTTTVVDQSNITTTSYAVSSLSTNTIYYWHVNATNSGGASAYSTTWTFTTLATPAGLVAAYAFDEGTGTTVADASGHGFTGTISGATWTTSGKFGSALVFNGTNAVVTIPNATLLQLTTGMTLEAWVNPTTVNSAWRDVIYKGDDNYYLEGMSPSQRPAMGGTFSPSLVYGTAALAVNTWTHLAATYDGTTMRLYVNGAQVASRAQTGNIAISTNPLQIGGDSIYGQYFAGMIDEVRIYNRALTQTEIQIDMNTPVGAPPSPPVAPVLATPANGATGIATNPTLTWNASTGATSYRLQVSTDAGFATMVVDQSNITTASHAVSSLATNTTYYWHVNATNSAGTSAYSTAWSFTTVAPPPPPAVPVLAAPSDGATGIATNPTLTWNASTGATSYRVQVSTSSAFTTTVVDQSNITTTSYAVSSLATNTIYYWHVNATNSGGTSAYSTAWSFTTVAPPPPPAVPVLATPSDGATGIATNPTLTWNASTGATSYRVQVSTSSAFTTTVVDQSNITTTSYAVGSLSTNTIYYWHVNATNSGGASAYSTTWTFTTLATPAGLVAAYAFDEGTGTTVADASGHGFTGTISGATWTTSGKFGSALVFNGTNAVVTIPNATLLQLTTGMTLEAWVYPTTVNSAWRDVIYKGDDNYYLEGMSPQSQRPGMGGTFSPNPLYGAAALTVNTWAHLGGDV